MRITVACLLAAALAACTPKATKEDCEAACKHLTNMQQATAGTEQQLKQLDAQFKTQAAGLEQQAADAVAKLDKELKAKLPKAKKPAAKQKLEAEYAAKKEAAAKPFKTQIAALAQAKDQAITQTRDSMQKAMEQAITTCAEACVAAGWSKDMTDCQVKADTIEAYGQCQ